MILWKWGMESSHLPTLIGGGVRKNRIKCFVAMTCTVGAGEQVMVGGIEERSEILRREVVRREGIPRQRLSGDGVRRKGPGE